MNISQTETDLYITSVDNVGPYLRISGQLDHVILQELNNSIRQLLNAAFSIEEHWNIERKKALLVPGTVCIYHAVNDGRPEGGAYLRARILNASFEEQPSTGNGHCRVEIDLIDFGYRETVSSDSLFFVKHTRSLFAIRPLITQYILLGIFDDWNQSLLARISQLIQYNTITIKIVKEIHNKKFVNINWRQFNLCDYLIEREGIGTAVQDEMLIDYFREQAGADAGNNNLTTSQNFCCNINNNIGSRHQYLGNSQLQSIRRSVTERLQQNVQSTLANQQLLSPLAMPQVFQTPIIPNRLATPIRASYFGKYPISSTVNRLQHIQPAVQQRPRTPIANSPIYTQRQLNAYEIHDVVISSVQTGPYSFSVQLKTDQPKLEILMRSLERSDALPLSKPPFCGMACMVRYSHDNSMYRAVVIAVFTGGSRVHYIDYGNMENVPNQDLFKLPRDLMDIQPFAMHFALSGIRTLEPIDDDLRKAFQDMVFNKYFKLRVEASEGLSLMQYCTLFNDNINVYEELRRKRETNYMFPGAEPLKVNDMVVIRYIKVPKEFYVQKVENIQKFDGLMNVVCAYYNKFPIIPKGLWKGAACVAKFGNIWYRSEVVTISGNEVTVRHVDFGCYQKTDLRHLSVIERQHMVLPRQAVRCCLKGFDHIELNKPATKTQLEMLAEESAGKRRPFSVEIYEVQSDGLNIVNLHTSEMNVMKRLLKLSMPMQDFLALEKQDFNLKYLAKICSKQPTKNSTDSENIQRKVEQLGLKKSNRKPKEYDKQSTSSESSKEAAIIARRSDSSDIKSAKIILQKQESRTETISANNANSVQQRLQNVKQEVPISNRRSNNTPFQRTEPDEPLKKQQTTNEKLSEVSVNSRLLRKTFKDLHPNVNYNIPTTILPLQVELNVEICWWISPQKFYIHLNSESDDYAKMQSELEEFYKDKLSPKQLQLRVGHFIICRHRTLNKILRAKIVEYKYSKRLYRVFFLDLGDQLVVSPEDVWPLEEKFSILPSMAHQCSIGNIIDLRDHRTITERIKEYFLKGANVNCKCLSYNSSAYGVEIIIDGVPLKSVTTTPSTQKTETFAGVNINLLAGQQIRVKIFNIQNIYDFKVMLENIRTKHEFLASYDDPDKKLNSERSNEFKQFYEGKIWTIKVTAVVEDKRLLLRPLSPLFQYETQHTIYNYPVLFESLRARITFVSDYYRFYVHLQQNSALVESNKSKMNAFYKKDGKFLTNLTLNRLCAAKSPKDNSWQRALLLSNPISLTSKQRRNAVDVRFVDLGHLIRLSTNEIRELDPVFYSLPALALEINMPIIECVKSASAVVRLLETVVDDVTIKPLEVHNQHIIADVILSNGQRLIEQLTVLQLLKQPENIELARQHLFAAADTAVESKTKPKIIETIDLTYDEENTKLIEPNVNTSLNHVDSDTVDEDINDAGIKENLTAAQKIAKLILDEINISAPVRSLAAAVLGHCDNPTHFYVHPSERNSELVSLQENLQIIAPSLPKVNKITKGTDCVALCSVDKHWYRARVLDAEIMVLKFIDYGRTDYVPNAADIKNCVKPELEPFCKPCALPIRPEATSDWVDAANNIFIESHGKQVLIEYLMCGNYEKPSYINLFIGDTDVAEQLVADGYAKALEIAPNGENCYISHCNNISDFYVQFEYHNKALKFIEDYLFEEQERFEPLQQYEQSKIIAAVFREDGNFYRAELLAELPNGGAYEVRFIDYGNTSVATNCRLIPQEIANIPALSKKCALKLPNNCLSWSPEAESHFSALAQQEAVYILELQQPAVGHVLVNLVIDGRSIVDELVKLCDSMVDDSLSEDLDVAICEREKLHEGDIIHALNCDDFYVRLKSDAALENIILEKLNSIELPTLEDALLNYGTLCAVRYHKDGLLYRAAIEEQLKAESSNQAKRYRVRLIDYGYETITDSVFALPADLKHLKALVKHCSLAALTSTYRHSSAAIRLIKQLLIDECAQGVLIEFIDEQVKPSEIGLFSIDDHYDLTKKLKQRLQESSDCSVSYVPARPNEGFYIQRVSDLAQFSEIEKTLQPDKWNDLERIAGSECSEGLLYVCRLDDGTLQRCILVARTGDIDGTFDVALIDSGNTVLSTELRRLPANLECIPALAVHCELKAPGTELIQNKLYTIKSECVDDETGRHVIELDGCVMSSIEQTENDLNDDQ